MALRNFINCKNFLNFNELFLRKALVINGNSQLSSSTTVNTSKEPVNSNASKDLPVWEMENPFKQHKQVCILCRMQITPDYKNVKLLSQFVSRFTGQVYGRHITRLCKSKQEAVEKEIRKAGQAGLMPQYFRDLKFAEDPKLFNPERPLRPHRF